MAEVKITNLVKFYTVLLLSEKPKHGYDIIKEISEKLDKKISPGEIYPFLKLLKKHGLIGIKVEGRRKKKIYSLTKKGRDFVKKSLNRFGNLISIAIEPKITVCIHCGCKVYESGYKERIRGRELKFCCHHCAKSYKSKLT